MWQTAALRARGVHVVLPPRSVINVAIEGQGLQQRSITPFAGFSKRNP